MAKKTKTTSTSKSPVSKRKNAKSPKTVEKATKESDDSTFVSSATTKLAISELSKFLARQTEKNKKDNAESGAKLSLFDDEDSSIDSTLFIEFNTKKYVSDKPQFKPKVVELAHPIYNRNSTRSCLIVRDEFAASEEQIETLENENLATVSQILPVSALKTEFKTFEKRRELHAEYDLFLVDQAVFNLMPTLLGKTFYGNSFLKIPIPVKVTSTFSKDQISVKSLTNSLERALNGSAYLPPVGTSISLQVGSIEWDHAQLAENVEKALPAFSKDDLVSVMLKTKRSPTVPIFYTKNLYSSEDVVEEGAAKPTKSAPANSFEEALLELAPAEDVRKVLKAE